MRRDRDTEQAVKQAHSFLETVIGPLLSPERCLPIWTLPDKLTQLFADCREAARYAIERADDSDVYLCTCAVSSAVQRGRGKFEDMAGMIALRVEIDVSGPGHKAKKLPPNKQIALQVLDSIEPKPAVIVDSGGGLHAYVLLEVPWIFQSDDDRRLAQTFIRRYWATIAAAFAERGWHLDPAHDLPRVLRVPGTMNRKDPDNVRPVELLRLDPTLRYTRDQLDKLLVPAPTNDDWKSHAPDSSTARAKGKSSGRSSAGVEYPSPSGELIRDLCAYSRTFEATWNLRRSEFTKNDGTPDWSRYDQAIASIVAACLWDRHDSNDHLFRLIAGIIQAFREKNCTSQGDRDKARRPDYLELTIAKALAWAACANDRTGQRRAEIAAGDGTPHHHDADVASRCSEGHSGGAGSEDDDVPLVWQETWEIAGVKLLAKKGDRKDRVHVSALRDGRPIVAEVIAIASGRSREKLANNITSKGGAGDDFRDEVQDWLLRVLQSYEDWNRAQGKFANDPQRQLRRSAARFAVEIGRPVRQWSSGQDCYVIPFNGVPVEITEDELDDFAKLNRKVRPHIKRSLQPLDRQEMFRFMGAVVALAVDRNEQSTEIAETLAWLFEEFVLDPCGSPRVTFTSHAGQVDRASLAEVIDHVRPLERLDGADQSERPETHLAHELYITGYLWDTEGRLYVRIDALVSFLVNRKQLKVTAPDIKRRLAHLGFDAMENSRRHRDNRLWAKRDGRSIKVSVWRSPKGFESHTSVGNEGDEH